VDYRYQICPGKVVACFYVLTIRDVVNYFAKFFPVINQPRLLLLVVVLAHARKIGEARRGAEVVDRDRRTSFFAVFGDWWLLALRFEFLYFL
jgi:hypothetical protein